MTPTALTLLLTAQGLLGLALLALLFLGARKPVLTALHLLLGAGALESLLYLVQAAPRGAGGYGIAAAALVALALLFGLAAPMLGRRSRRIATLALAAHIGLGAAGFVAFLAWAAA